MAKRVPEGEKPFRPVDAALVRSVISPTARQGNTAEETAHTMASTHLSIVPEKFDREKRMLLTRSEERAVERLVSNFAEEMRTPVKLSHVLRACTSLILKYEKEIIEEARKSPKLTRPPNGDMNGLSDFEQGVSRILEAALQQQ